MKSEQKKWTSVAAFSAACLATLGMAAATCGMAFLVTQAQERVSQSACSNSPAFSQDELEKWKYPSQIRLEGN